MKLTFPLVTAFFLVFGCSTKETPVSAVKGLYAADILWQKETIVVCFIPNPTLSREDRMTVQRLVNSTWLPHIELKLIGWNDCDNVTAPDISIEMSDQIIRGSSYVGRYSHIKMPSMRLRSSSSPNSTSRENFEYGIVHESDHALGILHEFRLAVVLTAAEWSASHSHMPHQTLVRLPILHCRCHDQVLGHCAQCDRYRKDSLQQPRPTPLTLLSRGLFLI